MKKTLASLVRTLLAIAIIAISFKLFSSAWSWEVWAPNNDLGFAMVCFLYWGAALGILAGVFGISPVFWSILLGGLEIKLGIATQKQVQADIKKCEDKFIW